MKLILSFLSPSGRIGIIGYWWRQLLLALVLYPSLYYSCASCMRSLPPSADSGISAAHILPLVFAQVNPLCGFSAMAGAADAQFSHWQPEPDTPLPLYSAWQYVPELPSLLCYLIGLLAAWSSFALMLRRLRDSGLGLRVLPLCLPLFWVLGVEAIVGDHVHLVSQAVMWTFLILTFCFTCWPSRGGRTPAEPRIS